MDDPSSWHTLHMWVIGGNDATRKRVASFRLFILSRPRMSFTPVGVCTRILSVPHTNLCPIVDMDQDARLGLAGLTNHE